MANRPSPSPSPSPSPATDWFGALSGASQGSYGNYANRGEYIVEVLDLQRKISQDPRKSGHRLIVGGLRIVEVITSFPAEGSLKASNVVGETVSFFADLDSAYPQLDQGRLRGILEHAVGAHTADAVAEFLTGVGVAVPAGTDPWVVLGAWATEPPGDRLAGMRVRVSATPVVTKAKNVIVKMTFSTAA